MTCMLKNNAIFIKSDFRSGSVMARILRAFFVSPYIIAAVCFCPERETLTKDLTAKTAAVFILEMSKTWLS